MNLIVLLFVFYVLLQHKGTATDASQQPASGEISPAAASQAGAGTVSQLAHPMYAIYL